MNNLGGVIDKLTRDEQLELIEELWYDEAAQYAEAVGSGDSRHHLERCDLLLDAHSAVVKGLGVIGILGVEK